LHHFPSHASHPKVRRGTRCIFCVKASCVCSYMDRYSTQYT
jgi:hypothetical protein